MEALIHNLQWQALGLSKEQYKALSLLPYSATLGLEDAFLGAGALGAAGHNEALLRSCKVSLLHQVFILGL